MIKSVKKKVIKKTASKVVPQEKPDKVKSILITQPKPDGDKSPYFDLEKKYNLKVDFRPFIHVEGVSGKDFRKESKVNLVEFSAIIFTSRNAVDNYFRICEELRLEVPQDMKYFCVSESTALYLQKYIQYRKRKVFFGRRTSKDLMDLLKKNKDESYLFPCTDVHKDDIPDFLKKNSFKFAEAVIYKTVCSDLSDLADVKYDILAFFSPSGIKSLYLNFPKFIQDKTRIAAFGPTTCKAVIEAKLTINIQAPSPSCPSMTMAIEEYIKSTNK